MSLGAIMDWTGIDDGSELGKELYASLGAARETHSKLLARMKLEDFNIVLAQVQITVPDGQQPRSDEALKVPLTPI